jgi:DNA invertase Pin-like site-specific DNA recombinase
MLVGYCRVSTVNQVYGFESQEAELVAAGCEKIFSEQVSSVGNREQLEQALGFVREGDTLIVTRADRLSRGVADLLSIIERLEKRGVSLRIMSFGGGILDTANATSKLILTVLAATAAWEREVGRERQLEGIRKAKIEGKFAGRQPTARRKGQKIMELHNQGIPAATIAKTVGISRASTYRIIQEIKTGQISLHS